MAWLIIAIIAHFISATVFVIDKFILSHTSVRPAAYAFYVGLLSLLVLFLIPFGFGLLPLNQIIIALGSGALFIFAILFFYKSVQLGEVSRITPIIGAAIPIFTFILTFFFLKERLSFNQLIAFSLLVFGGLIMAWPSKSIRKDSVKIPLIKRLPIAILSASFFAGSFVSTKYIFDHQTFINGFIWTRLGSFLGACFLLLLPSLRAVIFKSSQKIKSSSGILVIFSKGLSALGFTLLNFAIFLGSVTLVNSLQGVQYVFLLIVALFLSKKFPQIIKEQINRELIIQKIIAIVFISFGLGILVF